MVHDGGWFLVFFFCGVIVIFKLQTSPNGNEVNKGNFRFTMRFMKCYKLRLKTNTNKILNIISRLSEQSAKHVLTLCHEKSHIAPLTIYRAKPLISPSQ